MLPCRTQLRWNGGAHLSHPALENVFRKCRGFVARQVLGHALGGWQPGLRLVLSVAGRANAPREAIERDGNLLLRGIVLRLGGRAHLHLCIALAERFDDFADEHGINAARRAKAADAMQKLERSYSPFAGSQSQCGLRGHCSLSYRLVPLGRLRAGCQLLRKDCTSPAPLRQTRAPVSARRAPGMAHGAPRTRRCYP